MKGQNLFSAKKNKKIILNLWTDELAQSVLTVIGPYSSKIGILLSKKGLIN